ncbi:MAG: 30S ribosomal protein S8 [Candidatus Levybacteria bacterium RIFCSPHIGHO2_02_FULL_39_36]|nr:MAG: 30S ribosomal protein S8 [Candidatus Levybacteria bacterium GW2011_GWA1_39_11]KKR24984.1 MAG: 30S ribosomal protein S8 [Candidatus Levybacteria bacterium GW2011_GWB1_39_7]KKR27541.1 MAG: 30S ribosomal protein S8 [Microgenomates group bacterium GW2011_GWC1_39_7]KKR48411.1 MAG: 30S ribosomal protein S8 [Candidatus Levybacteria bacterium GW2011_GWA2_40_16]OGH25600.1 MAG: 30S ribosomal protein S8 [Candidatus Levybacteria bacterium RIFCSPHIGHO2_12_FULL_39_39]OGH28473.1 MAG: 30S ribosomal pr
MYTIGDFLIQIKNAYGARKKQIEYRYSNAVASIGKILEKEGFISKLKEKTTDKKKSLIIDLKYNGKVPAVSQIKIISKPSVHYFLGKSRIKRRFPSHALGIISTSRGIMTSKQAEKEGVGGELICQIS